MFIATDERTPYVTQSKAASDWGVERLCGPKWEEVTGEWRKLHKEEFRNLYSSPNIVKVIKSRSMRWERHIVRVIKERNTSKILVENQNERAT
jgi:hypothetical protein